MAITSYNYIYITWLCFDTTDLARASFVVILFSPPQSMHKLRPVSLSAWGNPPLQIPYHTIRPVNKIFAMPLKAHYCEEIRMWLSHSNRSLIPFDNNEVLAYCFDFTAGETESKLQALAESCSMNALDPKGPATNLPAPDSTHPAEQSQCLR
jgi:hypothetical protein